MHFRVDPKFAHVLGENYTLSEKVLKELHDNAWDAEVPVTVPNILTGAPIIVQDNGSGMKTAELEAEYLNIASLRFSLADSSRIASPLRKASATLTEQHSSGLEFWTCVTVHLVDLDYAHASLISSISVN